MHINHLNYICYSICIKTQAMPLHTCMQSMYNIYNGFKNLNWSHRSERKGYIMVKEDIANQVLAMASSHLSPSDHSIALPILKEILIQRENAKSSGMIRKIKWFSYFFKVLGVLPTGMVLKSGVIAIILSYQSYNKYEYTYCFYILQTIWVQKMRTISCMSQSTFLATTVLRKRFKVELNPRTSSSPWNSSHLGRREVQSIFWPGNEILKECMYFVTFEKQMICFCM